MTPRALTPLLYAIGVMVAAFSPHQQNPPPTPSPQQPTFRSGTDVVEVDVSVFDKDRHAVRGLKQSDFTILEDGKPQPIVAFAAVDLPDRVPPTARWMDTAPVDVDTNQVDDRRVVIIILDDALSSAVPDLWKLRTMKETADRVIDGLGPSDLAAVVYSGDSWSGQSVTSDRARLRAAVDRLQIGHAPMPPSGPRAPGGPAPQNDNDCSPVWNSAGALRTAVDTLSTLEHRRKLVIDISVGLPLDVFGVRDDSNNCIGRARTDTKEALATAQAMDVNVYAFDPSGLKVAASIDDRQLLFLRSLAENAGGRAIINTNAPASHVPEIFEENKSYYLLGYTSHNEKTRESLKRVEAKVNRPDVEVRSRSLYAAPASVGTMASKPASAAPAAVTPASAARAAAIAEIVPKADLPLRVSAEPFRGPDGSPVLALVVGVREPASVTATTDKLDVSARLFTVDGRSLPSGGQTATVRLLPAGSSSGKSSRAEVLARVAAQPGRTSLRIVVHSDASQTDGSVYTDADVPDFAKEPLSLSGVVLSAADGPRAAPTDALSMLIPVLPTAERTFDRSNRVSVFARVYQGGSAAVSQVALHIQVLDDHDAAVTDRRLPMAAEVFASDRSGELRFNLKTPDWHPGAYLLSLEATLGKHAVTRAVRFEVR